ncbi:MAG: 2,3-bisphosphoglycerate-independent phosphoglycerate mutase [Candidatus Berkelbacteria bacterium]|nr:2,3-bisphosphoglycerate-independent phosphoglycerate mutase [Candidatus Berkelbacteria bacterium]
MEKQKVLLIILDGWGEAPAWGGNAVEMAKTPNMDDFWRKYPHTILKAAEEAVGLPRHEPGNSEVGHLNLGSGQIVRQNLPGITKIIEDKSFFKNEVLIGAVENAKNKNSNIHIIGLLSDGGVHSHIDHLFALLDLIKQEDFSRVFIHIFTDGRDTDSMKALSYLSRLEEKGRQLGSGKIESISGRYYAMDRDNRWERVSKCYDLLTSGIGEKSESAAKAISESYRQGRYDEFIIPTVISQPQNDFVPINDNDSIIFYNFRADRTRELTWAFVQQNFRGFNRRKVLKDIYFSTFAFHEEYEERLPVKVIFKPGNNIRAIAKVLSENNLKQFHIAETEKYAHITYFFNGGQEKPFMLEDRKLISSPKVPTYDLKPEMSASQVTEEINKNLGNYSFMVANFANPDMG